MREEILARLARIETEEAVNILYACESGSRAWGFPSADSDFDVRFLYLHPRDWYLSIDLERRRDVIERPIVDEIDLNGWDLRKALLLFWKSNPPLLERLDSPIVYRENGRTAGRIRRLAKTYYSPKACMYHYLHMAKGNYREYLKGERVWVKKYFYVLRPVLAIRWLEKGLGVVPMKFRTLVDQTVESPELKREINRLIVEKERGAELDDGPRNPIIGGFLDSEMHRLTAKQFQLPTGHRSMEELNALFRGALEEAWGLG
jgi:predicted nucleotidyltransferase